MSLRGILFITIILSSCHTTKDLPSGLWTVYLSQQNQVDKQISLNCRLKHHQENVSLQIFGPGGINIPTRDIQLTKDSLFFSFDKVEEQMSVSCALGKHNKKFYHGTCTDTEGKWSVFTMKHNSIGTSKGSLFRGIRCSCHWRKISGGREIGTRWFTVLSLLSQSQEFSNHNSLAVSYSRTLSR